MKAPTVPPKSSRIKVIRSGNLYEVYIYELAIQYGYTNSAAKSNIPTIPENVNEKKKKERSSFALNRARKSIKRLAEANFSTEDKFITLTFAENMKNIETANRIYTNFTKRLRRRYGNFKYITILEFQSRGAVHYHQLATLPFIPKHELFEIWNQGWVKINRINHVSELGAYICKYLTKATHDGRLTKGKKSYFCSRNLDRPKEHRGKDAWETFFKLASLKKSPDYQATYDSEYNGSVTYYSYRI